MRETSANEPLRKHRKLSDDIETGEPACPGKSMVGTYLLAMRCPVYRRRESHPGSRTELENLSGDDKGKSPNGRTVRLKVPMRQLGTDCFVVAEKRGNSRGAKGAGHRRQDRTVNRQREEPTGLGGRRQPSIGGTSRMNREVHVRICERLGVKFPGATRQPAPERERKTTWKEFLCRHREVIVAADFFTIEAWTRRGLTRFIVLFLIDLSSRKVQVAGVTKEANGVWMSQVGRNLCDAAEGFLIGKRYLIHDRDPLFTAEFQEILKSSGVQSVKLPPCSPNRNAYAERFVRTIKESCLERMILFGEGSLRKALREFVDHYHYEPNHQGLGNRLILKEAGGTDSNGVIQCRQRLGGMLNYYHRQAA